MAAGVAGQVDGLDRGAAAEVEDVAVDEALGVGPRRVVEVLDDLGANSWSRGRPRPPSSRRGCDAGEVLSVDGTRASGNRPLPAVWSSWLWLLTTASTGAGAPPRTTTVDRRVDDHRLRPAPDQQRVARRVGAVGVPDQHVTASVSRRRRSPIDRHHDDGTARVDSDAARSRSPGAKNEERASEPASE